METILLAVTGVSLLVALIMSAAAWRLSRDERARAAARVAALATAASSSGTAAPLVDELPLREVPRVPEVPQVPRVLDVPDVPKVLEMPSTPAATVPGFLSGEAPTVGGSGQRGLMAAAAILFVVLGFGAYQLISSDRVSGDAVSASTATANAPLELISLRHERVGSKLSLSGLVKNPAAGAPIEGLNAVVFLFDAQGGFISSGRVAVDFKQLGAGDESPFVVTMDAPSNVTRYRVSFRTDAGVVAHVDRRSEQPVATAIVR